MKDTSKTLKCETVKTRKKKHKIKQNYIKYTANYERPSSFAAQLKPGQLTRPSNRLQTTELKWAVNGTMKLRLSDNADQAGHIWFSKAQPSVLPGHWGRMRK
ncbi:hypothetical protein PoB_003063200 [Plakobranchus ocellatus]|uniref:Uncharacterized protein n=1 Tax=Plakobranchus ocellatus TaxID=259542 RepID=A0AAV4AAV4_9GAST|nr:hypothetical protein PoB_003063200 [Plakobranchus ocellatus]